MNIELRNKFVCKNLHGRCMRVVNDNTGEYYDIPIISGTNTDQRTAIADHAHVLSGYLLWDENRESEGAKFEWTRHMIYSRDAGEVDKQSDFHFFSHENPHEYWSLSVINKDSKGIIEKELCTLRPYNISGTEIEPYKRYVFLEDILEEATRSSE